MNSLDLGIVGNCTISALIDKQGDIVWSCFHRFDGDPVFNKLLNNGDNAQGVSRVELDESGKGSEQHYIENTAVLVTRLTDRHGDGVEITDFRTALSSNSDGFSDRPRWFESFAPSARRRESRSACGRLIDYGARKPEITRGSNHIRYVGSDTSLRLTTNAPPLTYILDETPFILEGEVVMLLGPDESLRSPVIEIGREFLEQTAAYWRTVSMRLSVPFEWQDAVIRAAITLKLCTFEETGGIVAAMTTSVPEIDGEGRNWDYRFLLAT